jgi:hypothetical protein
MDDLVLAKKALADNEYTLCVFKNKEQVFFSKEIGVLTLYNAYKNGHRFNGCSAADKVIGLGAAFLWKALNVSKIDTGLISKPALDFLNNNDIEISYRILTDRILNRTKDGYCPVETLAKDSLNFGEFLKGTGEFLKEKGLI